MILVKNMKWLSVNAAVCYPLPLGLTLLTMKKVLVLLTCNIISGVRGKSAQNMVRYSFQSQLHYQITLKPLKILITIPFSFTVQYISKYCFWVKDPNKGFFKMHYEKVCILYQGVVGLLDHKKTCGFLRRAGGTIQ